MVPDLGSSRGESTTSKIGFYPGNVKERLARGTERVEYPSPARSTDETDRQTEDGQSAMHNAAFYWEDCIITYSRDSVIRTICR